MTRNLLSALCASCIVVAAAIYLGRDDADVASSAAAIAADRVPAAPFVMFRALAPREAHGRVAFVAAATPGGPRHVSPLVCARVHYAGGTGLCLAEEAADGTVRYVADFFDRTFTRRTRLSLAGIPTRGRVSPDGRLAAITVYAEEEGAGGERLASRTTLVDTTSGRVLADLHDFTLDLPAGAAPASPRDFASVAFDRDGDRFFATMMGGGAEYLVTGSIRRRRLEIVATGLASEALSPDGTRLIVKRKSGARGEWQLAVFTLAGNVTRVLDQAPLGIDDQVEWLDDHQVIYHEAAGQSTGAWVLDADGGSAPRLLIADAYSPSSR